jgi:tetratricopeptide (TPR) repeat protein
MFPRKRCLLMVAFVVSWCGLLSAQDKPWLEVRSPHFRVITNGSDRDARHVARAFEQMRAVFASQFPGFVLEAPAPLLVLAARNEETMKMLFPQMWKAQVGTQIAGIFQKGWERQYAVVRLDVVTSDRMNPDTYAVVYHEYVHTLLHANFRWLPTWLDEGLAEFYAYTRFEGDRMYIGAPTKSSHRLDILDSRTPLPLRTFITTRSSVSRDAADTHLFYAEAWALTHFLTFGPGMDQGEKLKVFFNLLQRGMDQQKAFEQAFGNIEEVDKGYLRYINQIAFPTGVVPYVASEGEKDYSGRQMGLAETQAELSAFEILDHHFEQARGLAEAALKSDPKTALAHEDMGFVAFNEGKDEDALREFSQAVDLDPKSYISFFAKTMMSPISRSTAPANQKLFQEALLKVVAISPRFAPAYVELAKLDLARGEAEAALKMAQKAEGLEPFRSGYRVMTGQILLRSGHPAEASARAAYVADRWGGPDHDEAMELWNSIPAAKRVSDSLVDKPRPNDDLVAEGMVKSVSCKDRSFVITLESEGKTLTFHRQGFTVGFSDTLWVGRDHFTPCFHVDGLRAVARYKVSSDKSYAGDILSLGFRDNLSVVRGTIAEASTGDGSQPSK